MNARELAAQLDRIEYPWRPTNLLRSQIAAAGLVVVYGASDDLMEFVGAIHDEVGAYGGTTARVDKEGVLPSWEEFSSSADEDEETFANYFRRKPNAKAITAHWGKDGYSWTFTTDIPHAVFDIDEDGEPYCRGIIFSIDDI